jgi:hypothetical protein
VTEKTVEYVWVTTTFMESRRPRVERYQLLKKNPKGGVTVQRWAGAVVIRPALERRFFYDEQALLKWYRSWLARREELLRNQADEARDDLKRDDCAMIVDNVPSTPPPKTLKT